MISDDLQAMQTKIAAELARRPECFIVHPREVGIFQQLTAAELQDFAGHNGWRAVRRVGGRQWQFYQDTFVRAGIEGADRA